MQVLESLWRAIFHGNDRLAERYHAYYTIEDINNIKTKHSLSLLRLQFSDHTVAYAKKKVVC